MTTPGSLASIHAHWAERFQCPVETLLRPRIVVLAADPADDWYGVNMLQHATSCLISAPASLRSRVERAVKAHSISIIVSEEFARDAFSSSVDSVIGPAWLGYANFRDFRPVSAYGVRVLTTNDSDDLDQLAAYGDDWEQSGISPEQTTVQGRYVDGVLVAAGMVAASSPHILNVGIVTHPAHRGRGYGKAVVSVLTGLGLNQGSIMQYRTVQANTPSMAIAQSLGYQQYGCTIAIRLRRDDF